VGLFECRCASCSSLVLHRLLPPDMPRPLPRSYERYVAAAEAAEEAAGAVPKITTRLPAAGPAHSESFAPVEADLTAFEARGRDARVAGAVAADAGDWHHAWLCPACLQRAVPRLCDVWIYWEDSKAWFPGTVTGHDVRSGRHRVLYRRGNWEMLDLSRSWVWWTKLSGGAPPPFHPETGAPFSVDA